MPGLCGTSIRLKLVSQRNHFDHSSSARSTIGTPTAWRAVAIPWVAMLIVLPCPEIKVRRAGERRDRKSPPRRNSAKGLPRPFAACPGVVTATESPVQAEDSAPRIRTVALHIVPVKLKPLPIVLYMEMSHLQAGRQRFPPAAGVEG